MPAPKRNSTRPALRHRLRPDSEIVGEKTSCCPTGVRAALPRTSRFNRAPIFGSWQFLILNATVSILLPKRGYNGVVGTHRSAYQVARSPHSARRRAMQKPGEGGGASRHFEARHIKGDRRP